MRLVAAAALLPCWLVAAFWLLCRWPAPPVPYQPPHWCTAAFTHSTLPGVRSGAFVVCSAPYTP